MSDHLAAQITIGGCISRAFVPGLCTALAAQRAALEWGDAPFTPTTVEELLAARQMIDGETVLRLYDSQARHGQFVQLESFLLKRRIAFDRRTEGRFDHAPELVAYRPDEEQCLFVTDGDEIVVPAAPLWELADALSDFRRQLRRDPRIVTRERFEELLARFRRHLPPRPTPLGAFEIGRSIGLRSAA